MTTDYHTSANKKFVVDGSEDKPNLVCNFRAPTLEEYLEHKAFCREVKDDGLDICRVLLGFEHAYRLARKGSKEAVQFKGTEQVVNLQMQNQFLYQVSKPRREPYTLNCVKSEFRRTFSSLLFEAYVLDKARDLKREFSFRDFLELKHGSFHRIVRRLKAKHKVIANPERTIPRFYILTERLADYPNTSETNRVKQLFAESRDVCDGGEKGGVGVG